MTLNEIIQDIHGLEAELAQLEKRYGLLSPDFYHLYKAGELDQSRDFIQWVGYYEAKLERETRYREMMPPTSKTFYRTHTSGPCV